jgi:broad specificity phosphatase PhoE
VEAEVPTDEPAEKTPTLELAQLWLLRHGQSEGNVARDAARGTDSETLDIADRDMDVPLSELGREQARSFGEWLAGQPRDVRPEVVLASPYRRAAETATIVAQRAGARDAVHLDERLRERELGVLDLLTQRGIVARFPDEAKRRRRLGKFYYRPPGGESWVDVAFRLRSLRDSLVREHADRRVLLVAHEVPIILMRYLLEELDEQQALRLSSEDPMPNCGLTTYRRTGGRLTLDRCGWTAPLELADTAVTDEPDAQIGSR